MAAFFLIWVLQYCALGVRSFNGIPFRPNAMNARTNRVLGAASAGQQVMTDNAPLWDTQTAIVTKMTALDQKLAQIVQLEDGITTCKGIRAMKAAARKQAAQFALRLAKPMKVFARDTGLGELEGEIDLSWTELFHRKDQEVIDLWQLVHDRAATHQAALVAGNYTEADWTSQLQTAIAAFKDQRGRPKAKRSDAMALRALIALRVKELQIIKADLLDLLVPYMLTEPVFYHAAKAAFGLDLTGIRHLALRLHFTDMATGIRLPKVRVQVVELALWKSASRNGRVDLTRQQLPPGNYTLALWLKGYADQTVQHVAVTDRLMTLEVVMVKNA